MGSIVVYKQDKSLTVDQQRREGMIYAGTQVETRMQSTNNYWDAVLGTLHDIISPSNKGYDALYEFQNETGKMKQRRISHSAKRRNVFDLEHIDSGKPDGHLVLEIKRDERVADVHFMTVLAPRRSNQADAFGYLATIVEDVAEVPGREEDYLKGTVTFQRCL